MKKFLIPYWILCFVLTHLPPSSALPEAPGLDKVMHFGGYSLLGFLLSLYFLSKHGSKKTWILRALGILAAYSVLDELTQPLVGRDFEVGDLFADSLGGFFGISAGRWAWRLKKISPDR